jgi:glycolate oxidase iron-sulfur subunit
MAKGASGPDVQTAFTAEQLARPHIAEADGILRTCVHYGFCTATCPTYVLFRDENDSPRGRIDLIRAMLEKGGAPDPKTVHHLDRCLSCLSCVTTCAVKVDYTHLIDIARNHIEKNYRRPLADRALRALIAAILPYPVRFAAALRLAKLARPLAGLLPPRLSNLLRLAARPAHGEIVKAGVYPALGTRRMRVALLAGCAQQALDRNINAATIRVLQRHGCDVVIAAGVGCCGALPLHMGREDEAKRLARKNVVSWSNEIDAGLDAVVINASGCGTTVKDYGHLLGGDEAKRIGSLTRDVTELLTELGLKPAQSMKRYRVCYHDACSLQHGQRVMEQPRGLLAEAGFDVVDVPERHFCCGSAGTYNLLQPDIATSLGQRKAAHVESVDPDIVAAGNLGCMVQIRRFTALPVVHTIELLDWATGGPMPPALAGRPLREPSAQVLTAATSATSQSTNTGIW